MFCNESDDSIAVSYNVYGLAAKAESGGFGKPVLGQESKFRKRTSGTNLLFRPTLEHATSPTNPAAIANQHFDAL
jgi:hypothetical protein